MNHRKSARVPARVPALATPRQAVLAYLLAEANAAMIFWSECAEQTPHGSPRKKVYLARAYRYLCRRNGFMRELESCTDLRRQEDIYAAVDGIRYDYFIS